jgi:hypothetical protein
VVGSTMTDGRTASCGCLAQESRRARHHDPANHIKNLVGAVHGRLRVLAYDSLHVFPNGKKAAKWRCQCECGNTLVALGRDIQNGHTRSCGCIVHEMGLTKTLTHGHARKSGPSPEYRTWAGIRQRCTTPGASNYAFYGGRGITMCDRWLHSFENFLADVGPKPSPKHSIDRIDNARGYEPGNVRWITHIDQMQNTRRNRIIEFRGERASASEDALTKPLARARAIAATPTTAAPPSTRSA